MDLTDRREQAVVNWQRAVMKAMRIKDYPVRVHSIHHVSEHYRRITFEALQAVDVLEGFPTEWVRLWVPELNNSTGKVVQRGYTLARLDKSTGQFDLEFVLHDIPGAAGDWAKTVTPGYETEISLTPARPKIPEHAKHLILVGDLTALPAINSWIGHAPGLGIEKITVLVEAAQASNGGYPQATASTLDDWRWIAPTPVLGAALAEELDALLRQSTDVYVWGAGEKDLVKRIRTVIKSHELGREASFCQFYWILGKDFG